MLTGNTLLNQPEAGAAMQNILAEASVAGAKAGAETLAIHPDYTAQLSTISVPTLILEGDFRLGKRVRIVNAGRGVCRKLRGSRKALLRHQIRRVDFRLGGE